MSCHKMDFVYWLSKCLLSLVAFIAVGSCLDRIYFDVEKPPQAISIDGFISDQPGPYRVMVSTTFDIDSKVNLKTAVTVKGISISDDLGYTEELKPVYVGIYETVQIRGAVGRVYKLRVEFFDGGVYESIPDTLLAAGKIDSIYAELNSNGNSPASLESGTQYGFDIYAKSFVGNSNNNRFMWSCRSTFRVDTHPELVPAAKQKCYLQKNGVCTFIPPCSGLINRGSSASPIYVRVEPCTCCTCWYDFYNIRVVLSDNTFTSRLSSTIGPVHRVPLSPFVFLFKVRVEVIMRSLTLQTYHWWKAIYNQQHATGSLFQPVTGKIPLGFVKLSGAASNVQGIFFAAGLSKTSIYLTPNDIPFKDYLGKINPDALNDNCFELFPNATNTRPTFWVD